MADVLPFDLLEKILVQFDVKNLLRYKSVCKSWYSLISSSRFVKAHLNHTCNKHHEIEYKRIAICDAESKKLNRLFRNTRHLIVGSSNGLLCIYLRDNELEVANPSTREVKKLQKLTDIPERAMLCCGFGYDLSTDDYKVIVGIKKLKMTKFYLLKLRSNSWEFIKDVNYKVIENCNPGSLYHGTINWLMKDQLKKKIILSFDLTKEEFKEIPLPNDSQKSECYDVDRLGLSDDQCMLIYKNEFYQTNRYKRVMENNTVKESWKLEPYDKEMDEIDKAKMGVKELLYNPWDNYFFRNHVLLMKSLWDYKIAPMFVESLVSPHRKRIHAKEGDLSAETAESGSQKRRRIDLQNIKIVPPERINHWLLQSNGK
ncbi:putative F-box domain-containing protein [Tanacetum coccineum]